MVRFPTWAGILVLGLALSFGSASAFTAPTVSPGVGGGSLQLDASGNLGVGTSSSTPISTLNATSTESGPNTFGKVFMVASSTNPGIGLKNLTPSTGNTFIWSSRNFGNLQLYRESQTFHGLVVIDINPFGDVAIGTSTQSTGAPYRLNVGGNILANAVNATVTGNVPASGVTTGIFSSGNFAFQNALGVGTSSLVGLPTNGLLVTGTTTLATTAGNVGIGTTAPDQKLQVAGNIRIPVTGGKIAFGTAGATPSDYLMLQDIASPSPALEFTQDSSTKFVIQGQTGNVGIGTSTPNSKLHIYSGNIFISNTTTPTLTLNNISGGTVGEFALRVNGENFEIIEPEDSSRLAYRISESGASSDRFNHQLFYDGTNVAIGTNSDGNVGIRTSNPSSTLHVVGSTTITDDVYLTSNKSLRLDSGSNTTLLVGNYNSGGFSYGTGQTASLAVEGDIKGNRLCFGDADCQTSWGGIVASGGGNYWVNSGSNLYPSSTSWNVGIGTTTPVTNLQTYGGNFQQIKLTRNTANSGVAIGFANTALTMGEIFGGYTSATAGYLAFETNTSGSLTEKMRIDTNGNVGIGTATPVQKLTVNGEFSTGADSYIAINTYYNSGWKFINNGNGAARMKVESDGGLYIYNSNSAATADGTITSNIGLVISQTGNVGVGTTTPSTKLHVVTSSGNAATFSSAITVGYPALSTDAARKDYVDAAVLAATSSQYWTLGGSSLYPNSASYNVSIGTTTPAGKLHVAGMGYSDQNANLDSATNPTTTTAGGLILDGSYSDGRYRTRLVKIDRGGNLPLYIQDSYGSTAFNNVARFGSHSYSTNKFEVYGSAAFSGSLGLGTTTAPATILDVYGSKPVLTLRDSNNSNNTSSTIVYRTGTSGQYAGIEFHRDVSPLSHISFFTRNAASSYAERVRIDAEGNVGIGTTTPSTQLHVVTGSGNAATFSAPITVGYPVATTDAARKDYVDSNFAPIGGSAGIWINSGSNLYPSSTSWNVGVGTTTPANRLAVVGGNISIQPNQVIGSGLNFDSPGAAASSSIELYNGSTGDMTLRANYVNGDILLFPRANVGIGTTTPGLKLSVENSINSSGFQLQSAVGNIATGTVISGIDFYSQDQSSGGYGITGQIQSIATKAFVGAGGDQRDSALVFFTTDGVTSGERLRIVESGNVGIGTTTPSTQLHVVTGSGNAATFSSPITIGYPVATTDAARKDYVDSNFAPIGGTSGVWRLSGSNVYPSSTSYSVGIGTSNPEGNLDVRGMRSIIGGYLQIRDFDDNSTSTSIISRDTTTMFWSGGVVVGSYASGSTPSAYTSTGNLLTTGQAALAVSSGNVGIGTAVPGAKLEVGTTTATADVVSRVLTADGYNAGFEAYGASQGTGYLYVGQASNYGGGIFYNGDANPAFATGEAADRVSFFRKNSNANEVVFSYLYSSNVVDFRDRITIGYPTTATDAARKDYVDNNFASIGGTAGVWRLSGSSVYPSSTSYNVGIGLTNPAAPLNVYATTSLATSTETIRLSAPQNYTAGFGPKLSFWNGTSEQLALITGSIQNTGNGNYGRLDFGTRTSDALGVQTKMSILADGGVGIGTTTPATKLHVVTGSGNAATFSSPITIGYPVASTDAARKDYVDSAVNSGNATSSKACNGDATCEITNADFGGTGNITGVNKLTVTTIDPLYEIKGKKYSTYASAIAGGVKEEYVGRGEMKKSGSGKWQMVLDLDSIQDGSDLWVWKNTVDFSEDNVEVLVTPIGSPVPMAYEVRGNKIIFSAQSRDVSSTHIKFSYRLVGKRVDWKEWPTFAKDQSEKPSLIIK